jgi:hypothetical protein
MGLINLAQRSTQVLARASSDTTIATQGMGLGRGAIEALGRGDVMNGRKMSTALPVIRKTPTQTQSYKLVENMAAVVNDAERLRAIKPFVLKAAKGYVEAAQDRAEMATALATSGQKVSVINSAATAQMQSGQTQSGLQTRFAQIRSLQPI